MKNRIMTFLLAIVLTGTLSACGSKKVEEEGSSKQTEKTGLEEFTVVLDWYPNAVHGFIYEAIEKGYYEAEGLDVQVQFPSNTNDAISLTAAGKADAGIYYLQDVIAASVNQNVPVKAIGTIVQSPLNIVLSLKEKNITSPKDLEGKKVGYSGTELSEAILKEIMENQGVSVDSVELIDVGFDLMSAMTTGNVDATIGGMVNHEAPALEEEGFEVNYFLPSDFGVPNYYELVFVTGDKQIETETEKLTKFLRASKKGFEDMKADPEEALEILLKHQNAENFPLNENVEKKSFEMLIPLMETENEPFLYQDSAIWQKNADWLFEKGLLNEKIDASELLYDLKQ